MKRTGNLAELFEQARKEAQQVPLSGIQSVVESGKTSPLAAKRAFSPRRITRLFNPLKILIMITPIIIITSALLIWNDGEVKTLRPGDDKTLRLGDLETERLGGGKTLRLGDLETERLADAKENTGYGKDTVFKGEILELSKEEFTGLGFLFDEEGFYYRNRAPGGTYINLWSWNSGKKSNSGFEAGEQVSSYNKQKQTELDFYPVLWTSLSGQYCRTINPRRTFTADTFNIMNDTLVPVLFKKPGFQGNFTYDILLWFKPSDAFYKKIGTEQGYRAQKRIARVKHLAIQSPVQEDRVIYEFQPEPIDTAKAVRNLKTLKLSPEIFRCMGFQVASDTVSYLVNIHDMWLTQSVWAKGIKIKRHLSMDSSQYDRGKVKLYFIARYNEHSGYYPMGTVYGNRENYKEDVELCIPVQLDVPDLPEFIRDAIFWIYPNDRFFRCLPPEIAVPLEKEFNFQRSRMDPNFVPLMGGSMGIKGGGLADDTVRMGGSIGIGGEAGKDTLKMGGSIGIKGGGLQQDLPDQVAEPVPCVYFTNLCESLPGVDYVNLYPNPATDKLNVDLVLQQAKKIRFRVMDIAGKLLEDEGVSVNFPEGGKQSHQVDVSKLQSGMYLLVMTDEEGVKLTRRFVKN